MSKCSRIFQFGANHEPYILQLGVDLSAFVDKPYGSQIQKTLFFLFIQGQTQGGFSFGGSFLNYGSLTNEQGVQAGSVAHRRAWEAGHVDYQGRDSFNNIQEQLEKNISQQQQQYHPSQQRQTTPPQLVQCFFFFNQISVLLFFLLQNRSTSASAVPTNDTDQIAGVLKTTTITTTTTTTTD